MDVEAVLRCWPILVTLGDRTYEIPALSAADWVEAIAARDVAAIVPGLLEPDDEARVSEALAYGDLNPDDLLEAARDAVEAAAGRPWWEAFRLVYAALDQASMVFGYLAERGFDFERASLGAFCAAVYSSAARNMEKKDRLKFDMALNQVPPDVLREDEDALTDAFMRALREQGGGRLE